jgi:SNF2 family DNA or RNA helicase
MTATIMDVRADMVGDRIHVQAPYDDGRGPALARAVGGGHWSRAHRVWTYPLNMATCRALRRTYGDRLDIRPALWHWAKAEKAREEALPRLAAAGDAPLRDLGMWAPRLVEALRPYQRVGASFVGAASRPGAGSLLADEPRTGKTLQAIAGILDRGEEARGLHLVVCPRLSVENVWAKEIRRWTDCPVYAITGMGAQKTERLDEALYAPGKTGLPRFIVVNYEMVRYNEICLEPGCKGYGKTGHVKRHQTEQDINFPALFSQQWASITVDESHKVFGSLRVNKGTQAGNGLKMLPLEPNGIRLAVTGTPFGRGGRVMGMFGTLHWLRPKEYTSFWRWADLYLQVDEDDRGHKVVGGLKKGLSEEEFYRNLGTVILRRTRAEVMPWLGDKVYEDVYVDMTAAQAKQYRKMEKDAIVDGLVAAGTLNELTRLKQFANARHDITPLPKPPFAKVEPTHDSGKLAALLERLDEHGIVEGGSNEKAIVFTQFEQFATVVADHLRGKGLEVAVITGKVSDANRTLAQERFQAQDGPRIMVMTTQTGGVSITLDRASSVHMLDEMWNPEDNVQAEDRAVNTQRGDGDGDSVAVYYYRSQGTVEGYVRDTNIGKAAEQHAVLDGRRGLEYARRVIEGRSTAATKRQPAAMGGDA